MQYVSLYDYINGCHIGVMKLIIFNLPIYSRMKSIIFNVAMHGYDEVCYNIMQFYHAWYDEVYYIQFCCAV